MGKVRVRVRGSRSLETSLQRAGNEKCANGLRCSYLHVLGRLERVSDWRDGIHLKRMDLEVF
jgi:hypothetical protein